MKSLKENILNNFFSHIYVEKDAFSYKITKEILKKFSKSKTVEIDNYKEVFSSNNQNFRMQKLSPKLIIAVKKENFIYAGADVCQSFSNENFYYTSFIINCIFDCEYCYLQGVYPSANIVIFVNIEDFFNNILLNVKKYSNIYLCVSYDTDMLAFNKIYNFVSEWYNFVKKNKNIKIELRTKSSEISELLKYEVLDNFIIAFSLSPFEYSKQFEKNTASTEKRLETISKLQKKGWKIRLCIDPIIYEEDFENKYSELIKDIFQKVDKNMILDVSIGAFRISKEYLKKMRKQNNNSKLLFYPYTCENGVYSYSKENVEYITDYVKNKFLDYIEENKIYI